MQINISALSEENLQTLFIEFPMPLVLMNLSGGIEFVNKQFDNHYRTSALAHEVVEGLIHRPQKEPIKITLSNRSGEAAPLLIYSIQLSSFILLVFDDTPGGVPDEELQSMRERLVELERLSATDPLTGAWNRLPLKRTVEVEINRSLRYHQPISLLFFDIDRFKSINDTYGHKVGDQVLKRLVDIVRFRIRASDTVYRWGGEEFVVLAPSTDHKSAGRLAESLRALVETHEFPTVGHITISVGVAEFLPGDDLEMWVHRADKAAYAAKAKGRNHVVVDAFGGSDLWERNENDAPVQLIWHDVYECGVSTIDNEHRELFEQSNRLIGMMLDDVDQNALFEQMNVIIEAIIKHFHDEETYLVKADFPTLEQHKQLHQVLLRRANALREEVLAGKMPVGHLLEYVVYDVVAKHILLADREYLGCMETFLQNEAQRIAGE